MKLTSLENNLIGNWVFENGQVHKDEVTLRVEWLIKNCLIKLGTDSSGWDALFIDPDDKRLWELVYLQPDLH